MAIIFIIDIVDRGKLYSITRYSFKSAMQVVRMSERRGWASSWKIIRNTDGIVLAQSKLFIVK